MRRHAFRLIALLSLLTVPLLSAPGTLAAPWANSAFQRTWERTDKPVADLAISRTWMWGPVDEGTNTRSESYAEAPSGQRIVQYFDKSRMEDNSYRAADPWDVTNGLLVVELMTGKMQVGDNAYSTRHPADINVSGDLEESNGPTYATIDLVADAPALSDGALINQRLAHNGTVSVDSTLSGYGVTTAYRVTVPNLDHQVASVFWTFMNSSGTVWEDGALTQDQLFLNPFYATGYPVTEAYWANIKVGGVYKDVLMQCFERRCLTYTPGNPIGWQVEAGNVGLHYYMWRYRSVMIMTIPTVWTTSSESTVTTTSSSWLPIPDMERSILVQTSGPMAVTFSSEVSVTGTVDVRAMIDGVPANPSSVPLAVVNTSPPVARSFTFGVPNVGAGHHTIRMERRVHDGTSATMGFRTLSIITSPIDADHGNLSVRYGSPGSSGNITTPIGSWSQISDMATDIATSASSDLAITMSAVASTSGGRLLTRVLVDGNVALPSSKPTLFAQGGFAGTNTFTWVMRDVSAGTHHVVVQGTVDPGSSALILARTLLVQASPPNTAIGGLAMRTRDNDAINNTSLNWVTVPDMTTTITTPGGSELSITFTAEAWASSDSGRVLIRALIDGNPADPFNNYFAVGNRVEARAFTFSVPSVSSGTHTVVIQWKPIGTDVVGYLWNRTVTVTGWPVPDTSLPLP